MVDLRSYETLYFLSQKSKNKCQLVKRERERKYSFILNFRKSVIVIFNLWILQLVPVLTV